MFNEKEIKMILNLIGFAFSESAVVKMQTLC